MMSNWRQPGSLTVAAPFSLIATRKAAISAGAISRSTALTYVAADCADARWVGVPNTAATASAANSVEVKKSLDTVDLNMSASLLSGDVLVWGRLALMRPGLLSRGDAIVSSIGGEDNFTGAAIHTPLPRWVINGPKMTVRLG